MSATVMAVMLAGDEEEGVAPGLECAKAGRLVGLTRLLVEHSGLVCFVKCRETTRLLASVTGLFASLCCSED